MRHQKRFLIALLVLAIFLLGIPSRTPLAHAAATACNPKCKIVILSPGSGGALNSNQAVGTSFLVAFYVVNFTLVQPGSVTTSYNTTVPASGPVAAHNEGHIHVFVDGTYYTLWANENGIPMALSAGTHTIRLDLVNDLHQEFSPGVNSSTTVNVSDPTQSAASNAQTFSIGALAVSIVTLILVAYIAFMRKPKTA
jgi:ABC-type transport system involved in multi-copper enzyme maturation permease subunit